MLVFPHPSQYETLAGVVFVCSVVPQSSMGN